MCIKGRKNDAEAELNWTSKRKGVFATFNLDYFYVCQVDIDCL